MDLYEILYRWNTWGDWQAEKSYPRQVVDEIYQYLQEPEMIAIIGPRRSGKSTVMYRIMQRLELEGLEHKAMLHINFEEPALSPLLKLSLLDELYDIYRNRVYPKGKAYIFLDEVQNLPEWERWARARNDTEDIKIIVTGSSAQLMSRELATLLTGRHLTFEIYPLSFREILQFRKIDLPNKPYPLQAPPEIQHVLFDYLEWGSFPRIVLSDSEVLREKLLKRYFEDILYKDIITRHNIRDVKTLRNIAIYMLTNTASLISYKRLCDLFAASHDLVQSYTQYLQEAFLIDYVSFYSFKAGERSRKPFKSHAIDLGLRRVVSLGQSSDKGKLVETLVHNFMLNEKQDGIFYWQNQGEVDLLIRYGIDITQLIQVVYTGLEEPKVFQRELNALMEAGKQYPDAEKSLVTFEVPKKLAGETPEGVDIIPLWQFLLK